MTTTTTISLLPALTPGRWSRGSILPSDGIAGYTEKATVDEIGLKCFSVKAWGATGDGVTDDTAAIYAACQAATNNAALYFPPGTYCFSQNDIYGPFYVSGSLHLVGAGIGLSILKNTHATGAGVKFAGGYSSIRGFTIDANGGSGVSLTGGGQGFRLDQVLIKNQVGANFAFVINGGNISEFSNLIINLCDKGMAVGTGTPTQYLTFRNIDLGACAVGPAVSMLNSSNIKFFGLVMEQAASESMTIDNCSEIDVYSMGAEFDAAPALTAASYILVNNSRSVNFWGGRINHYGTAAKILWKFTHASTSNVNVQGFEIISTQANMTVLQTTAAMYGVSVRNIRTLMSAAATGVQNTAAMTNLLVEQWMDGSGSCSHIIDAVTLLMANVPGDIAISTRANQVLANCSGVISGTGTLTCTRLGDVSQSSTAAGTLGFHGVTPIVKALLATGAGHTVDDVITALQNLGLVKQA